MRRSVTLLGVYLGIALFAINGFAQPRTMGARGFILDDGTGRLIQIANLNRAIGIGTSNPDPSSILHLDGLGTFGINPPYGSGVNAADGVGPRGFLMPRLTTAQRNDIESPANGLLIYNIDIGQFQYYNAGTLSWTPMATSGWSLLGNTIPSGGTGAGGNFIGTLNAQDFVIATNVGAPGSGAGERIRVTSAGAVNILTTNAGTTAIGLTGANSSSTAINIGNAGNLLLNGIGPVGAPFEFLTKQTGTNEVKVLGGGGSIAEQGVTFNNEAGNFRFRLGGLANTDNPLLANRFVNLSNFTLAFTNAALANLVTLNGATNAVNINTATAGNTSIGAAGSVNTITGTTNTLTATTNNITAATLNNITGPTDINHNVNSQTRINTGTSTGAVLIGNTGATSGAITLSSTGNDITVNTDLGAGTGNDLILNGIDLASTNYDLLLINTAGNAVRRQATTDLAEQGLIWQTEGDGTSKVRLGVRNGDALGLNALEEDRNIYLGGFSLNFSENAGGDLLTLNDATNTVTINGNINGALTVIGNNNAGDVTVNTDILTNSNDLVFNGLDVPQNDFDLLVINNGGVDANSVTRAAGPAVTEQGITFNNEGGETRIRHGSLTAGILPSDAPFEANRFENLNGFTYNITNSNAQGNDVMASFNGTTNAINFNTIDLGVVTIGNTTANRQLNVNGAADASVGSLFATTALWDQLITGDLGVTGLVKIGNSVWIDANLPTAEFRSENPLDIETNGADNVTVTSNGDLRVEINGATGNVGIGLGASPVSPLQVSANAGLMPAAPNQDGVHLGQDVATNHGISIVDNGATQLYLDFTNDFVNDFDARVSYVTAPSSLRFETPGNVSDHVFMLNGNIEMTIDGATGNTSIGTNAVPTANHQLYVQGTSGVPNITNTSGIQTIGTAASNLLTFGQVDASRAWIQTNSQPLTINELGQNVTIGTLAGGFGPANNTLLGNNNIITSNDDINMTIANNAGGEMIINNLAIPSANFDLMVIHDGTNFVRRANANTNEATEQGITFNIEGTGSKIRLGDLAAGTLAVNAPFLADRFVNLAQNELTFTGGAASTFPVLQVEGNSGVVNSVEISSQNAGNTIVKLNGPALNGIDIDPVTNGILIDATLLGIDVGTGVNKPDLGINVQPELTGINIDGQATTVTGVNIDMSAPAVTTAGATALNATITGIAATSVNGAVISALSQGTPTGLSVTSTVNGGVGFSDGARIVATTAGTGSGRGLLVTSDATTGGGGNIEGAVITSTSASTVGSTRALFAQAQKTAASASQVTGAGFNTIGNGVGTALGMASVVSGSTGANIGGQFTVTPAGAGSVLGIDVSATASTSTSRGANIVSSGSGVVDGILLTATNTGGASNTRGLALTTSRTGGGAAATTGLEMSTQSNGTGLVTGIQSVTNPSGTSSVIGANIVTSGQPGAPATGVLGIRNDVANSGAVSDVTGISTTVNDLAGVGGVATGASITANGGGFSANSIGITTSASGGTANNTAIIASVSGTNNIGVDVTHAAGIGVRVAGGGVSMTNDGQNLLGNNAGNDQLIVSTGTGPTTINTTANDVTINTDPASGTGNDLVLTGIDENPTSPFDLMVIEDGTNAVRRANSDANNQITEQGITFNTEGGQTRIRLGDLAAGTAVVNAPFEADRFVNLVQNSLNFTGGAASTSNVMRIQGNSGGALDQVSMTSLNATNTSILKLNGPAVTGLDIDPVQFGIRIDATNTLIQQTGSQPVNGLDMQVGVTGTGILLNDNDGVPSTVGANFGPGSVLLTGVRANAMTGFVSANSSTSTFTSYIGDGASYFGDNSGNDEFFVSSGTGEITLTSANVATGINLTTSANGGDGIDIVAFGNGEDVDILGNEDINLTTLTDDITLTAFDDNVLSATDNSITATTGSNTILAQVNNSMTATTGNNTLTAALDNNLNASDDNNLTATDENRLTAGNDNVLVATDDNLLTATDNSVTATTGNNTLLAQVNNTMTATTGNNTLTAALDNNLNASDDNNLTATDENRLTAGNDNVLVATDDNLLTATDNSVTATTGSNTILAQVNNTVTATTGNNTLTAALDNNLNASDDNNLTATDENRLTAGNDNVLVATDDNLLTATDDNVLNASDNTITATTGNNSITANNGNNQLTATLGDNVISATDNSMTATTGNNALTANVSNTFTATTGNNSFNAPVGNNGFTAVNNNFNATGGNNTFVANTSNTFTATTVNNSFTAALGDNLFSATDNAMTATSGDNVFNATSGENYLNAPLNRVGSNVLPTSTLHVSGSIAAATNAGGTTALTVTQFFYLVTANNQTITLPNAALCTGRIYVIKNDNLSTNTTVNTAGGNIDGGAGFLQFPANAAVQYISDGANWWIISTN